MASPKSGAFFCMGAGIVGAIEPVEDPLLILGRNPDAVIGNSDTWPDRIR